MGAFKKVMGMKVGGKTFVEKIKEGTAPKPAPITTEQTEAQKNAAAARKRRDRRMGGQRSLLYATRLTGAPEDETRQSTLG